MNELNKKRKRYILQRMIAEDIEKKISTWRVDLSSNDLETLKNFCTFGSRIFDLVSNKIVYEPK